MTQGQTERLKGHSPACLTPAFRRRGNYITERRLRKTLDLQEDWRRFEETELLKRRSDSLPPDSLSL